MAKVRQSDMAILTRALEEKSFGGTDVFKLIDDLGILYTESPMPSESSGKIQYENGGFHIYVNSDQSNARKRFTAAHELAHYLLHRDMLVEQGHMDRLFDGTNYNPTGPLSRVHESEANRLAAQILMPKSRILNELNWNEYDLEKLANAFGVSKAAMAVRLEVLNIDLEKEKRRAIESDAVANNEVPF